MAFSEFLQVEQALDDLLLPYRIDLSLLARIDHQPLREHIAHFGKSLWENPSLINTCLPNASSPALT